MESKSFLNELEKDMVNSGSYITPYEAMLHARRISKKISLDDETLELMAKATNSSNQWWKKKKNSNAFSSSASFYSNDSKSYDSNTSTGMQAKQSMEQ